MSLMEKLTASMTLEMYVDLCAIVEKLERLTPPNLYFSAEEIALITSIRDTVRARIVRQMEFAGDDI